MDFFPFFFFDIVDLIRCLSGNQVTNWECLSQGSSICYRAGQLSLFILAPMMSVGLVKTGDFLWFIYFFCRGGGGLGVMHEQILNACES